MVPDEMNNKDLYLAVCEQADKNPKDQETIDFLVNTASKKLKVDRNSRKCWELHQEDCSIRLKAFEGLSDVELTIEQLLRIMGEDDLLRKQIVQACKSNNEIERLRGMRLMHELNKAGRLNLLIPELINLLHANPELSKDETIYLNTVLDKKPGSVNYEDLFSQNTVNGAENLCKLLFGERMIGLPWDTYQDMKKRSSWRDAAISWDVYYAYTTVMQRCMPLPEDSPEQFSQLVADYDVSTERLIKLAFYAPQWKPFVAHVIGNRRFLEAVDWFTHIRYSNNIVDTKDISDFRSDLGEELWELLLNNSSVSWNPQEKRIYSEAISGKFEMEELIEKYNEMDNRSHWRANIFIVAIGFLPLKPEPDRTNDIVRRYQFLTDYIQQSKKFGRYRFNGNKWAGLQGLKALAGIAGYSDQKTFELAMETEAVKDLATGTVSTMIDEYELKLSLTDQGGPGLEICKDGRLIKSMPEKLKYHQEVVALKERVKQIRREASRLRRFLEEAMSASKEYGTAEFLGLIGHPILKPMMQKLIFVSKNGMGYPLGTTLRLSTYDGKEIIVNESDHLRIAHPYDLLQSGQWDMWQHECFTKGRIQPFKQVFRELYLVTNAEKNEEHESLRFSGQQVEIDQSIALFETRGWDYSWDESLEFEFDKSGYGINAHTFLLLPGQYAPQSLHRVLGWGLTCALGNITYYCERKKVHIEVVPPIFFSESMRDIDLVVSVAHAKESPWESSTSTVESRAGLVRETCQLLHIGNVRIEDHFAMVDGTLSSYKVHLGSGSIHQVPGNYVCVIPDNTKFQGKLFLPFIDKDEMTSIILSKIILLAHDEKIKDPVILNQIKRIT